MAIDTPTVKCEIKDFIALVPMDNPPVNAQNRQHHEDMTQIFDTLSDMDDVRVVVLTAKGKLGELSLPLSDKVETTIDGDKVALSGTEPTAGVPRQRLT